MQVALLPRNIRFASSSCESYGRNYFARNVCNYHRSGMNENTGELNNNKTRIVGCYYMFTDIPALFCGGCK